MPRAVTTRSPLRRRGVAATSSFFLRRASRSALPRGGTSPRSARLAELFPLRASVFEIIGSLPAPIVRVDKKTLPPEELPRPGALAQDDVAWSAKLLNPVRRIKPKNNV